MHIRQHKISPHTISLAATARSRLLQWGLVLYLVLTIVAVYGAQTPPGFFSPHERFFIGSPAAPPAGKNERTPE